MKKAIFVFIISILSANEIEQKNILSNEAKEVELNCYSSKECLKTLQNLKTQKDLLKFAGFAKKLCEIPYGIFENNEAKFQGCNEYLNLYENLKIDNDDRKMLITFSSYTCKLKGLRCKMYGEFVFDLANKEKDNEIKKAKFQRACDLGFEPACYEIY